LRLLRQRHALRHVGCAFGGWLRHISPHRDGGGAAANAGDQYEVKQHLWLRSDTMCACNDVLTVGNQAALSELRRCQQAEAERSLARELGLAQAITARAYWKFIPYWSIHKYSGI
jgi:hypothetical protein